MDNHLLEEKTDSLTKKIDFSLSGLTYLKNNEFFQPNLDGYTLTGQWFNPEIRYRLHEKVELKGGVFLKRNFGENKLEVVPTLSVLVRNNHWVYTFGNLQGHVSHRMVEPLFDFERLMTNRNELGFQAQKLTNKSFADIWLDWQAFTLPGRTEQEQIVFGMSFNRKFAEPFYVLSQTLIQHRGGQNLAVKLPVKTYFNQALGLGMRQPKWRFENYVLISAEGQKSGLGFYSSLFVNNRWFKTGLTYFYGKDFDAPMGDPIFQSSGSQFGAEEYYIKNPNVLMLRIIKEKRLFKTLNVSFRFQPFFDFNQGALSHSEGIYVRF